MLSPRLCLNNFLLLSSSYIFLGWSESIQECDAESCNGRWKVSESIKNTRKTDDVVLVAVSTVLSTPTHTYFLYNNTIFFPILNCASQHISILPFFSAPILSQKKSENCKTFRVYFFREKKNIIKLFILFSLLSYTFTQEQVIFTTCCRPTPSLQLGLQLSPRKIVDFI